MSPRILVCGIGNIFLGDDSFGVQVARRLAAEKLPDQVQLHDFGIRGIDLTYALLEDYEQAILIDAVPKGSAPGTLYVIEPNVGSAAPAEASPTLFDMHNLDPTRVMTLVQSLGGRLRGSTLVDCEPDSLEPRDIDNPLSEAVAAAVEPAVALVQRLIRQRLAISQPDASGRFCA
jgi:hydrogenase maturation protease